MAEQLFLFIQMEFPWELGPADGRYVLRERAAGEPEQVVVLETVGTARRRAFGASRRRPEAGEEPERVPIARVTVIDPVPLSAESQAQRWLAELEVEHAVAGALVRVNRVLHAHRIAAADPYTHELAASQALVIRAGWGIGEQVAGGRFRHAVELALKEPRTRKRSAALRPQERLAVLLGAREAPLHCEEHSLRARLDFDQGRLAHAAVELEAAYAAALVEVEAETRPDLAPRLHELSELWAGVTHSAHAARNAWPARKPGESEDEPQKLDEELIRHALERLEAMLRARTAKGWAHSP